jgi:predicted RNA-binding protein with PIN domain
MRDSYIIDGYNLIHALGMIQHKLDPGGLEESRRKLLVFLTEKFADDAPRVTVVFDAKLAPRGLPRQQEFHGMHVHFAPKNQSADDWIETLIDEETQPRALVVISNDMRLQNAAKHRGARAWSHESLLDYLEKRAKPTTAATADEKSNDLSPEEKQHWMKEFEALESDPELKEFFDLDRFDSEPEV